MAKLDDLFTGYKAGSIQADELLVAVRDAAVRYAQSAGYSDPEDIAQDLALAVFTKLPMLVEGKDSTFSFHQYVHSQKKFVAFDYLRKRLKGGVEVEFDDDTFETAHQEDDGLSFSAIPENLQAAAGIILSGFTQEEAARVTGVSVDTLKKRLYRARKKLS